MRHPEMAQDPAEFDALLRALDGWPPRSILEVGVLHGGVMSRLEEHYPLATIVGIDPRPMLDAEPLTRELVDEASNYTTFKPTPTFAPKWPSRIVLGCSQDRTVRFRAESLNDGEPFEVALIDGDHSYESVCADWEWARKEVKRIVAFHDVGPNSEFGSRRFWAEVRGRWPHRCVTITKDPNGYHGWGLFYL